MMLKKISKENLSRYFIIIFILTINYIFISVMLNNFQFNFPLFNYNYRTNLILVISIFGCIILLLYLIKVKVAINIWYTLLLCIYIVIRCILEIKFKLLPAMLSIQIFWFITYIISYLLVKSKKAFNNIISVCSISVFFMNIIYIYGTFSKNPTPFSVNSIYYILLAMPFVVLLNNKIYKNILITVSLISVLISTKSTAFIAMTTIMIIYYYNKNISKSFGGILWRLLLSIFLVIGFLTVYSIIKDKLDINIILDLKDAWTSNGSGRGDIYYKIISILKSSNIIKLVFGYGVDATVKYTGFSAHNDFLEILFNYGIVGLTLYMCFWNRLIKKLKWLFINKSIYSVPFLISIVIFFYMSMFSSIIFVPTYFIFLTIFWGSIFSITRREY